ncbi:MAG: carboxypeptidase regulatory-like domain-containing protein [Sandaracinaceae bacterium]
MTGLSRSIVRSLTALLLVACADSTASSLIVASEGGTVTVGQNTVQIPAGSLAADTEVVLMTGDLADYAPLEGARSQVLELLPEGTVLETPATVTIGADLVGASESDSIAIHQFRDVDGVARWSPMESSRQSDGSVDVPVTVFAPLGIVVTTSSGDTSTIEGTLSWADGSPVTGAMIELWMGDTMVDTATTGSDGTYSFTGLASGSYAIRGNPECAIDQGVTVPDGMTVTVDITVCGG